MIDVHYEARSFGAIHASEVNQEFSRTFDAAPKFFAAPQTFSQNEAAYVRVKAGDPTEGNVHAALCGLLCSNAADVHLGCGEHYNENVAYLAMGGSGTLFVFSQAVCTEYISRKFTPRSYLSHCADSTGRGLKT